MDEAEKVLERVDSMHLEFAKRAAVRYNRLLFYEQKKIANFFLFFSPSTIGLTAHERTWLTCLSFIL